jgi:uroporphyrinogen decarboxylase
MHKRERLERTLTGEPVDRPAVTLWRRFPGDDQRAADLAYSALEFQQRFDWDVLVIACAETTFVTDHGLADAWAGAPDGTRGVVKTPIVRSLDWTTLRPLDPARGALARHLDAIRFIAEGAGGDVPVVPVLPSPLHMAALMSRDWLMHARTQPDRLHSALNTFTDTLLRIVEALKRLPNIDGIYLRVAPGSYGVMTEDEYTRFGLAYDSRVIEAYSPRWWLSVIGWPAPMPILRPMLSQPVSGFHWADQDGEPSLGTARALTERALWGGLSAEAHLVQGTPLMVGDAVRDAVGKTNGRRLIVTASDGVPLTAPLSNLRAVRAAVERAQAGGTP